MSRSVAKLERELGVALLERTTRHVALTDAGRAFFERARDALVGLDQASELALDAVSEANGVVRIAAPPDFGPLAGAGIAQLPVFLAEKHVAARALVPVLPRYEIDAPLYVLTHAARHLPHRVALVRDALVAELGHQCTRHAG